MELSLRREGGRLKREGQQQGSLGDLEGHSSFLIDKEKAWRYQSPQKVRLTHRDAESIFFFSLTTAQYHNHGYERRLLR
jgi:hypothetical protein